MQTDLISLINTDEYLFISNKDNCLESGLLYVADVPKNVTIAITPSTPLAVQCLHKDCTRIVSKSGPLCEKHCLKVDKLFLGPSRIDSKIRGIFAGSCQHAIMYPRQSKSKKVPIFYVGAIVARFGGIISVQKNEHHHDESAKYSSYVIAYVDEDAVTGERIHVYLDSCLESSGMGRFANSIVRYEDRVFGEKYKNCDLRLTYTNVKLQIGEFHINKLPSLVATCDIYEGDEIITDYGTGYWTIDLIQKMSKDVQKYLFHKTNDEPQFFQMLSE